MSDGHQQERERASLFPSGYNKELGFGTDQVLSQNNQRISQVFVDFG